MTHFSNEELTKVKTITLQGKKGKPYIMRNYPDISFYGNLPTVGENKMPVLKPFSGYIPNRIVPFDEAYTHKETDCIVHFYEGDRRFMRLFHNPTKYLDFLKKCAVVIGPDLSQLACMDDMSRYFHAWHNRASLHGFSRMGSISYLTSPGHVETASNTVMQECQSIL